MAAGLIVLARLDSRRLPGKALLDLGGRPLLGRVFDRLRHTPRRPPIFLATSDRPVDDPLAAFAAEEGVACFRGSAEDVMARTAACAEAHGLDRFARVCGDSPFVPADQIGALLALHAALDLDVATNVAPRSFPPGASVEIVKAAALRRALGDADLTAEDREHVTAHLYRHPDRCSIYNLAACGDRYAGVRLTVDTAAELALARAITARLPDPAAADLDAVVAAYRASR